MKFITPRKPQGFWELMPEEEIVFENMLTKIKQVFENNCFMPLDTPVAEYSEILLAKSGGEVDKEIYRFQKGNNDLCLRYDLTVPLARFVAMNENVLEFPFKRYQIGKVYRGERPQKGRFREFYQCDADIVGENLSMTADAECVKLYEDTLGALNLNCQVKISNRKILAGFFEGIGAKSISDLMIIYDKMAKLPKEEITNMFVENGLTIAQVEQIFLLSRQNGNLEAIIENVEKLSSNSTFLEGLNDLKALNERLEYLNMDKNHFSFDLSIVRGHNYYTGTVFEAFIENSNLAIGGGGRYDNLCGNFTERKFQGVGMSIGITRLFDEIKDKYKTDENVMTQVGIVAFDETALFALSLMADLRKAGIRADIVGEGKSFKAKMKEANRRNLPYIIVLGEDEKKKKKYTLKDMRSSAQEKLSFDEIVKKLK